VDRIKNISLKNKIFFSTFGVILLLTVGIALDTRFVLVSGMTDELKQRGVAIAQSIADRSRTYVVSRDSAGLTSLVFDSALLEEGESSLPTFSSLTPKTGFSLTPFSALFLMSFGWPMFFLPGMPSRSGCFILRANQLLT
jgi:hypothetical protein